MARYLETSLPNASQGAAIDFARLVVDAAVKQIDSCFLIPRTVDIRTKLGILGDGPWKAFRSDKPGKHFGIAQRLQSKLLTFNADDIFGEAATTSAPIIEAAIAALQKVLVEYEEVRPDLLLPTKPLIHFAPLDAKHYLFAFDAAPSPLPLPRFSDFAEEKIIEPRAAAVLERLAADEACWLKGVHTFGKTTTALVAAFALQRAGVSPYFIDLGVVLEGDGPEIRAEFEQLANAKQPCLLLVDNAHRLPVLIGQLARMWANLPQGHGHRLLIVGTKIDYATGKRAEEMINWPDATLELGITPENFRAIAQFYVSRHANRTIDPPPLVFTNWSKIFANNLHAFCLALLQRAKILGSEERWSLDQDDALSWIRDNWLHRMVHGSRHAIPEREVWNLLCLSVFAEQDLELMVEVGALPYHDNFTNARQIGLVQEKSRVRNQTESERLFGLMESGWGSLILKADGATAKEVQTLRLDAIKQHPRLGLAVATRYVIVGKISECRQLMLDLCEDPAWLASIAKAGISIVCGWLPLLNRVWPEGAGPLRLAVCEAIATQPSIVFQSSIGQLAMMVSNFPAGDQPGQRGTLCAALSNLNLPETSPLCLSFATGFTRAELGILEGLPADSAFAADLKQQFSQALTLSLDQALLRGFRMVAELVQGTARFHSAGMETLITDLMDESRRALLDEMTGEASLRAIDPINQIYRWNGEVDQRIVELFYRRFEGIDWRDYLEPGRGGLATGPWMIKALNAVGMEAAATSLADLFAQRCSTKDLFVAGHEGNKRIEMIAQVCLHCSTPARTAAYFEAMVPTLGFCLREPTIYRGLVATGLWLLVRTDRIDLVRKELNPSIRKRAQLAFGLKDVTLTEQVIGDYMRLVGSLACAWPADFLRTEITEFAGRAGLDALLAHPMIALPEPVAEHQFVPGYQVQYWLALYQIARLKNLPLLVPRAVVGPLREVWRLNLAYDLEHAAQNLRVIQRHRIMLDWLDTAHGGAMVVLPPGSADLTCR